MQRPCVFATGDSAAAVPQCCPCHRIYSIRFCFCMHTFLHLRDFHRVLLRWYTHCARSFAWRENQDNPYVVLVSEVMLQQTQTARVEQKLPQFLEQFPTVYALAKADNAVVIRAWQGMGYNSRAIRLRDCARAIVEQHAGVVPATMEALLALPGIGRYTASAILSFAYGHSVPVVDVNIGRVYSRVFVPMATTAQVLPERELRTLAATAFPPGKSSMWHQAVMDLSALYCTARTPKCSVCPIADLCSSALNMKEEKKQKRPEPSWCGEPNRIWRGRVVEFLRAIEHGKWVTVESVVAQVFAEEVRQPEQEFAYWLQQLLAGLQRDALVAVEQSEFFFRTRLRLQQ